MRVVVLAAALLGFACAPAKTCSYTVDCTCECQDCSGGSCAPLTKQYFGHACAQADDLDSCETWAAGQKATVEEQCVKDCDAQIGYPEITCALADVPGNPVTTTTATSCAVKGR